MNALRYANLFFFLCVTAYLAYFSAQVSVTSEKVLYRYATIDALTNQYNRGYLIAMAEELFAQNPKADFSIMLIDLDYFKRVNDTYGHQCGDEVLQEMAIKLREHTRPDDTLSRWGGEEFLMLLPGTSLKAALQIAERVRSAVESHPFICGAAKLNLTLTIGVASRKEGEALNMLVSRADSALYEGKNAGRNCCRSAT